MTLDFVGVDCCGGCGDASLNEVRAVYHKIWSAINATNRSIGLEVYNDGKGAAWEWAPALQAPFFRTDTDIGNSWGAIAGLPTKGVSVLVDDAIRIGSNLTRFTGPETGTYPQYGQLVVGVPPDHPTIGDPGLSLEEVLHYCTPALHVHYTVTKILIGSSHMSGTESFQSMVYVSFPSGGHQ